MPRYTVSAGCATAMIFGCAASAARADVKVFSRVTDSEGTPLPPKGGRHHTVTTYYKGTKIRTEFNGGVNGAVIIYDTQADTMTLLDSNRKRYVVLSIKDYAANFARAGWTVKTTATVKPGGKTKNLAGKLVKNYEYQSTIVMDTTKSGMGLSQMLGMPQITTR